MSSAKIDPQRMIVDPQDPLPESNWVPRRWFVFAGRATQTVLVAACGYAIFQLGDADPTKAIGALLAVVYCLCGLLALDALLYLVAPSAEQATKMIQMVSALRSGVSFRSTASAQSPDGRVIATTSAAPTEPEKPLAPSDPVGDRRPDDPAPTEDVGLRPRERGTE